MRVSRMAAHRQILSLALIVGLASIATARTAGNPWRPPRVLDYRSYQKNQWRLPITNYGTFGYGVNEGGGEWPAGSGDIYIYGAGIWIGSLRRSTAGRDTLVTFGYNPNSGATEMSPGAYDNAPGGYAGRDFERVYVYPNDWPPNPLDFPSALQDSVATYLRLPPNLDDTIYFYFVPRAAVSSGDAWAVYNDRDPARHVAGRTPRPLGIEVYQSIYSWTLPWNKDIVFFKLDIRNRSADTLRDVYLGMVCDPDVGQAQDDRAGLCLAKYVYKDDARSDSVYADNLGYVWSTEPSPAGFVGFDFLQSPFWRDQNGRMREVAPKPGNDSIYPNGRDDNDNGLVDEPAEGRQLGMTAFKIFALSNDPTTDAKQYQALAGYDWNQSPPVYNPYDSTDAAPDDKRFLQATGPVSLAPGEMTTVTIAVIGAVADRTGSPSTWPYYLALASRAAQNAYDNNWIMPEPPPSPNLTTIPGDGRVTLVWDDLPESARDRFYPLAPSLNSPFYREQDFQGYKVYRSRTGQPGSWQLLAQYDRADGIVWQDTSVVESLRTKATDVGLAYSLVDSSSLRLGFPYYYAVTSFDINFLGVDTVGSVTVPRETLSLESGQSAVRAVPRTQPANYIAPATEVVQVAGSDRQNRILTFEPLALIPHAVRDDTFRFRFLPAVYDSVQRAPRYRFSVTNAAGETIVPLQQTTVIISDTATDTRRFVPTRFDSVITFLKEETVLVVREGVQVESVYTETTKAWLPVAQVTVTLRMRQIPTQFFDRVVVSGRYPRDSVQLRDDGASSKVLWAYRGSNYRIVWREKGGGSSALTCDVYDIDNDVAVPYGGLPSMSPAESIVRDRANGWSFQTATAGADTLLPGQTRFFYICGCRFQFRPGARPIIDTVLPAPGDTWLVYNKDLNPAPVYAAFDVVFRKMAYADTAQRLNVKVVPNPYLVRNEWERHRDFRKLKFINLPDHCTIRIYNLAGDLVRTLTHDATSPAVGGQPNQYGGDEDWDLLNESRQKPAPGVYIFHVQSEQGSQTGKFVLIF